MKVGMTRLIMVAAIVALAVALGDGVASAQNCPTSPNYLPDFSSTLNQNCLTPNGTSQGYPGFYPAVSTSATVLRLTPNSPSTAGSGWYNTPQPVSGAFSTTFTFQLSGSNVPLYGPADGFAFVIQNSALAALGPEGCGIGFGGSSTGCTTYNEAGPQTGIPNSLAIEFNTFLNYAADPSDSDVSIQSCQTGPNSVDYSGICGLGFNDLTQLPNPINLADGNIHTVTVNYSGPSTQLLDVILDNVDLFPATPTNPTGGVAFNMSSISLNNGNAWVGFTAGTGGGDDNQDILSWTFTPQAQTAVISQTGTTTLNFPNAQGTNVYAATALLTAPFSTPVITVQPILMTQAQCDALVQTNFWPARCFVYENAEGSGLDASVMFAITCPTSPGGVCGSQTDQFFAELGTNFEYLQSENPYFVYPGVLGLLNPFPGWLKGVGPDPLNPCTPPTNGSLFQSNQIDTFFIDGGTTKGKSAGTGSCWVATYDTPGELWPGVTISSPKPTSYTKGQVVPAVYACSNPITSKPLTSPTGPYLTAASCTQSSGTQTSCTQNSSGLSCTGTVDTSTKGLHTFVVTGLDSGGNVNYNLVLYTVK
ncbi:MAG: L-type lectin-domain containing protein [Terriglobales bacterium]